MNRRRVALWCLLVVVLGGSFFHYGATAEAKSPYPSAAELAANYDRHVGDEVFLMGPVVAADPTNGTMTFRPSPVISEVRVTNASVTASPGGVVQVYGRLAPGRTVVAETVVVVSTSLVAELYKYGASLVAAVLVLVAFFREWRIDPETVAFDVGDDG